MMESPAFVLVREPGQPVWGGHLLPQPLSSSNGPTPSVSFGIMSFSGEFTSFHIEKKVSAFDARALLQDMEWNLPTLGLANSHTQEAYCSLVEKAVEACQQGAMSKVVTSRREVVPIGKADPLRWFEQLCDTYSEAMVYVLLRPHQTAWIGASPEWLLQQDGQTIRTMSLAGTRPAGQKGLWGAKEKEEQDIVTQDIAYMLRALGCEDLAVDGPVVKRAGPVEHLCTWIEGTVRSSISSFQLAKSLHPTPAIGGLPRARAAAFLQAHEGYDRSLYAGFMGWSSASQARYFVNLRCMEIGADAVAVYAGGGITAQSKPHLEWEETEAKLQTLVGAIFAS